MSHRGSEKKNTQDKWSFCLNECEFERYSDFFLFCFFNSVLKEILCSVYEMLTHIEQPLVTVYSVHCHNLLQL